ncbi:MAG: calcium-binding protein [Pseudomonadota bacterium]
MKRSSPANRKNGAAAAIAAAGVFGVASQSQAQAAEDGFMKVNAIEGVADAKLLSDGSVELVLENGRVVRIAAEDVVQSGGDIMISESAIAEAGLVEGGGLGAFIADNALLVGAGVAAGGVGVAAAAGAFGGDDDNAPSAGDDFLTGTAAADAINGLAGNDTILGLEGDDVLDGGVGDDLIDGGPGNDAITGSAGADALIGDAGDDALTVDGADFTIDGGEGSDTIDLSASSVGANVDLDINTAGASTPGATPTQEGRLTFDGGADQALTDIENIIGTAQDDVLFGNTEDNIINAGAGDDRVHGFGGADTLDGGDGVDIVLLNQAGAGVTIDLEAGTVGASTITNFENANGGAFDDTILGDAGVNELIGGAGNDTIDGRGGADILTGQDGDDVLVSDGLDELDGGEGIDTADFSGITDSGINIDLDTNTPNPGPATQTGAAELFDGDNAIDNNPVVVTDVENVIGTAQNDRIFGNNEINVLDGGAGDDVFHSFGGADFVNGGDGTDTVLFSAGGAIVVDLDDNGDAVVGGSGDTITSIENITGSASGDDQIAGNAGANVLNGNGGADALFGEGGDDTLIVDEFDTTIDGGEGSDTIDLSDLGEAVNVDLDVNNAGASTPGAAPTQDGRLTVGANADQSLTDIENIIGTDFNDVLFGNTENNIIDAGAGDDRVHGFGGADTLDGGDGVDIVLLNQAGGGVTIDLAAGTVGASTIVNFEDANGGAFNDNVFGDEGDNLLIGGGGDDVIDGRAGSDALTGDAGADAFRFEALSIDGVQTSITDFEEGASGDRFQLDAGDFGLASDAAVSFQSIDATAALAGVPTGTELNGSNVIVLLNVDDDGDAGTVFNARSAAQQIADLTDEDGAGFFVYFNSALGVNRLVRAENLNDGDGALEIVARLDDITASALDTTEAEAQLAAFTADNFEFVSLTDEFAIA